MQAVGGLHDCSDQSQDWRENGGRNLPQGKPKVKKIIKKTQVCSIKCDGLESGVIFLDNFGIGTKRCFVFHFLGEEKKCPPYLGSPLIRPWQLSQAENQSQMWANLPRVTLMDVLHTMAVCPAATLYFYTPCFHNPVGCCCPCFTWTVCCNHRNMNSLTRHLPHPFLLLALL